MIFCDQKEKQDMRGRTGFYGLCGRKELEMDYSIVWVRGHVEVYDWAGRFCFSADSEREAREDLEDLISEHMEF